jgi:hypothetical protein
MSLEIELEEIKKMFINDILKHPLDSNIERVDRWVKDERINKRQIALLVVSIYAFGK